MSLGGENTNSHSWGGGLHKSIASSACMYVDCMCTVLRRCMLSADVSITFSQKQQHKTIFCKMRRHLRVTDAKKRHGASQRMAFPTKCLTLPRRPSRARGFPTTRRLSPKQGARQEGPQSERWRTSWRRPEHQLSIQRGSKSGDVIS